MFVHFHVRVFLVRCLNLFYLFLGYICIYMYCVCLISVEYVKPCPHDTFPNRSRTVRGRCPCPHGRNQNARSGVLKTTSRYGASGREAIGRVRSTLSFGRSTGRYRPLAKSAAVITCLIDLLPPRYVYLSHGTSSYLTPTDPNPNFVASCYKSLVHGRFHKLIVSVRVKPRNCI